MFEKVVRVEARDEGSTLKCFQGKNDRPIALKTGKESPAWDFFKIWDRQAGGSWPGLTLITRTSLKTRLIRLSPSEKGTYQGKLNRKGISQG